MKARNETFFSPLIKENFFHQKVKLNQYVVQAVKVQFSKVSLVGFELSIHQPLSKTLSLPNQILFLKLMSTAESRQKKFHPWPGTAFKSEASVLLPHRFSSSFVFPAESNAKRKREWRAPYGLRQQGNLQRAPKKYFVPQLRGFSRDLVAVFSVSLDTTMFGQTLTHWGGPC